MKKLIKNTCYGKFGKTTARDVASALIRDCDSIEHHNTTVIVNAFGHKYRIENAYSRTPKITQLDTER